MTRIGGRGVSSSFSSFSFLSLLSNVALVRDDAFVSHDVDVDDDDDDEDEDEDDDDDDDDDDIDKLSISQKFERIEN